MAHSEMSSACEIINFLPAQRDELLPFCVIPHSISIDFDNLKTHRSLYKTKPFNL